MGFLVEKPGHETMYFIRVKSLQPAKKGASSLFRLGSFTCSSYVFCNEWLFLFAQFCAVLESLVAWSHWNGCMNVALVMFLGGNRRTKPCVFRVKWLQPAKKGTSSVRRVRLWGRFIVPPMFFVTSGCSCVLRFLNLLLHNRIGMLHTFCMGYVVGRKPQYETLCFSV